MITGLELLLQAGDRLGDVERVAVVVGVLSFEEAKAWLEKMTFFDDARAPDWPEDWVPRGHRYYFQAWTPTRIWYAGSEDGVAMLKWQAITDEEWMRAASAFEPELTEIGRGRRWRFGRTEDAHPADDWTAEDDRAVAAGRVAEILDKMPLEQIERVLAAAREIQKS